MRIKLNLQNEPSQDFSEKTAFRMKSSWKPPIGHPNLEVFLRKNFFEVIETPLNYSNLTKEEWQAIRSLPDDRSIAIKKS